MALHAGSVLANYMDYLLTEAVTRVYLEQKEGDPENVFLILKPHGIAKLEVSVEEVKQFFHRVKEDLK